MNGCTPDLTIAPCGGRPPCRTASGARRSRNGSDRRGFQGSMSNFHSNPKSARALGLIGRGSMPVSPSTVRGFRTSLHATRRKQRGMALSERNPGWRGWLADSRSPPFRRNPQYKALGNEKGQPGEVDRSPATNACSRKDEDAHDNREKKAKSVFNPDPCPRA